MEDNLEDRLHEILQQVKNMEEPIHAKQIDVEKAAEGMSRQNLRFVALYRECLLEL